MTNEQKAWIDNASYEMLLHKWRYAPLGDPYFQNKELSDHFIKSMREKKETYDHVQASKNVGWD
jgi:hypothetical protein